MYRLISFFLVCFFVLNLSAKSQLDSLKYELFKHTSEDERKVELLNQLGYENWIINPVQSIIYGQQARALAEVIQDTAGLAFANRVVGVAHWARGSYDKGLEYLLNGLSLYKAQQDTLGEANCLMNIGLIYSDRLDNDLALKYFFDALKLFESVNAKGRSATTYSKIATVFIRKEDYGAAYDFLARAMVIHGDSDFLYGVSETLNRYGILKTKTEEYDSAKIYLNRSLDASEKIGDVDGIARNYINLADVAILSGEIAEADELLKKALINARKVQSYKWLKEVYDRLQQFARRRGDLQEAIMYYDQYVQQKDSIFNERTLNNIARLESELATAEQKRQLDAQKREIFSLEQEAEIQQTRLFALIFVGISLFIVMILYSRNRRLQLQRKEQEAKREVENAKKELDFKNRELVSYTVNFVQKNQLFGELTASISEIKKSSKDADRKVLIGMERTIKKHLQVDKDWEDFKIRFENLHTGFFDGLVKDFPSLTSNDLKLCALTKMNFSIKEISDMMGISSESVKTARYRLKKKLALSSEKTVNDFLHSRS